MNKTLLATVVFLSSISFFTGCADNTPKPNKKLAKERVSVYNIIGIKEPKKERPFFVVTENEDNDYNLLTTNSNLQDIPMAQTFPINQTIPMAQTFPINQTIPMAQTFPIKQTVPMSQTTPKYSNNIEVVSYGSHNNPTSNIVENINRSSIINKIEAEAKSFLGTRYVWGATGPNKFDCSGFTQWVFRDAGINIPRVSRDQAKVGQYVSFNNLRKGDMVFFDTNKHKKGKVTHVGIYLGNGYFIHASSAAKKVVVFNWNEKPYYKERFLWGRRVVQDNARYALN